jgi:tetratricopeptide (TPR) repeat protein
MSDAIAEEAPPPTSMPPPAAIGEWALADEPPKWWRPALGLLLALVVIVAGTPRLDAPWIQGDEFVFIVNNEDVSGNANLPWPDRIVGIFSHAHEDLYQPIPILTYAVEWSLSGGNALYTRAPDVALHAVNALLVWALLYALVVRLVGDGGRLLLFTWALALLWALHPVHITSYAADMCRTHLLSALFALTAMWLYVRGLDGGRAGWGWFGLSAMALLAAMLSKPVVGWFLLAAGLEMALHGPARALRSGGSYVRVGLVAAMCVFFAWLTLTTSLQSGMMEDTSQAVFGGPIERSLVAIWIYVRNLLAPIWLSTWYLSDPATGWGNWRLWAGGLVLVASLAGLAVAARRPRGRGIALGIVWVWAMLGPVLGVVAARIAAANDRYLYQPLIGILLAIGVVLWRWIRHATPRDASRRLRGVILTAVLLAGVMLMWDQVLVESARSIISRAQRIVDLNPRDPRALEALAQAYDFASARPTPEGSVSEPPDFEELAVDTFIRGGEMAEEQAAFFPTIHDRAAFHRRLSFRLLQTGRFAEESRLADRALQAALTQAQQAAELEPDEPASLLRLARAQRALDRWEQSLASYERLAQNLPAGFEARQIVFTELGTLLHDRFGRIESARAAFEAAIQADPAYVPALLGLARLEVRSGSGKRGYELTQRALAAEPTNTDAQLLLGEYRLRSHHWEDALAAYLAVLDRDPLSYEALRGFHEVCAQLGRWSDAVAAWDFAAHQSPRGSQRELTYRSFQVWAMACAADPRASDGAASLLQVDPDNRFACYASVLAALRESNLETALTWARRAERGHALPAANERERAVGAFRLLREREPGLSESIVVEAFLIHAAGRPEPAIELLKAFLEAHSESPERSFAEGLMSEWSSQSATP